MKNSIHHFLGILALTLLLAACGNQNKKDAPKNTEDVQTAMEVDHKVIFENDYAKVEKVSLNPGESQPTHYGENRMIYALTDYSIEWQEEGKKLETKLWKKGDVHFHKAGKHSAKNNGNTTAEWLVFAKKESELPECGENKLDNDVITVSSNFAKALFENEEFKIAQVNIPPGERIPMHSGINRIIYSLNDYTLDYESDKEGKIKKSFNLGDTHWHEACEHALQNIGETQAVFLVINYKRKEK